METEWISRRGCRVGRFVPKKVAREVLLEVADVVALVGLHRPVRDELVAEILNALDRACGRDPHRDYCLADRRRMARVDAAMAGGA